MVYWFTETFSRIKDENVRKCIREIREEIDGLDSVKYVYMDGDSKLREDLEILDDLKHGHQLKEFKRLQRVVKQSDVTKRLFLEGYRACSCVVEGNNICGCKECKGEGFIKKK